MGGCCSVDAQDLAERDVIIEGAPRSESSAKGGRRGLGGTSQDGRGPPSSPVVAEDKSEKKKKKKKDKKKGKGGRKSSWSKSLSSSKNKSKPKKGKSKSKSSKSRSRSRGGASGASMGAASEASFDSDEDDDDDDSGEEEEERESTRRARDRLGSFGSESSSDSEGSGGDGGDGDERTISLDLKLPIDAAKQPYMDEVEDQWTNLRAKSEDKLVEDESESVDEVPEENEPEVGASDLAAASSSASSAASSAAPPGSSAAPSARGAPAAPLASPDVGEDLLPPQQQQNQQQQQNLKQQQEQRLAEEEEEEEDEEQRLDAVHFSVFGPEDDLAPRDIFTLTVWAYLMEQFAEVLKMRKKGDSTLGSNGPLSVHVGGTLTVSIDAPKDVFEMESVPSVTLVWESSPVSCSFKMAIKRAANLGRARVVVVISTDADIEARIPVTLFIGGDDVVAAPAVAPVAPKPPVQHRVPTAVAQSVPHNAGLKQLGDGFYLMPTPHLFISYRKVHVNLAERLRLELEKFCYPVFIDRGEEHGLRGGSFQDQLEGAVDSSPVVLALLTPAPSASNGPLRELSSMAAMQRNLKDGKDDWCLFELEKALATDDKLVIPVAAPGLDWGDIWGHLPGEIATLQQMNGIPLSEEYFKASVEKLHVYIQRFLVDRMHMIVQG